MVFVRTKLLMQDNCYEEDPGTVEMQYIGPEVAQLYERVYKLMRSVFSVSASDIQEEKSGWGKAEQEKIKVRWYLHKNMDKWTHLYFRFDLSLQGDEKSGNAKIKIKPLIRTEYPQDTIWQRSLFYEMLRVFWHRIFYHRQRENFAEECRHLTTLCQDSLREIFRELREGT